MYKEKDFDFEWFPLFVRKLLLSRNVSRMTIAEFGIYMKMLCHQWMDGPLPEDFAELAHLCNCDREAIEGAWPRIGPCFDKVDNGCLINQNLEDVRAEQIERYKESVEYGYKGAEARYGKKYKRK